MANLSLRHQGELIPLSNGVRSFADFSNLRKQGGFPLSDSTMLTNSSGQVPSIPGLPGLIDSDTPQAAYTRTGFDGQEYKLVFSDEVRISFSPENRSQSC